MRQFTLFSFTLLVSLFVASFANAQLTLDKNASQVNFVSIKNEHIAEMHSFDHFSGELSDSGELLIEIDLSSVNTLIPIRNERMQSMLFNVSKFSIASFSAKLDKSLMSLEKGMQTQVSISGDLSLHGKSVATTFDVNVTRLADGSLQASTVKPTLLNAAAFDLVGGLKALQEVAMLKSISQTVPLSFSVVFK